MSTDSLWKNCKTCSKKIAVDAKMCPHCGSRSNNKGWVKWVVGGFFALVVLGNILAEFDDGPSEARVAGTPIIQSTVNTSKSSAMKLNMPQSQLNFVDVVESYSSRFSGANNELQESVLRDERQKLISSTLSSSLSVKNWVGTIVKLETNADGKCHVPEVGMDFS